MIRKYLTPVLLLILLIFGAVWWLRSQTGAVPISAVPQKPLELVERLKSIKIDTAFLDNPQLLNLEDFPKPTIEGIGKGRSNPFSPR